MKASSAAPERPGATRVTIADVARHTGVSKGTVSRALNGYTDISESTRLRVARAAERLGYRPLSHAQAIRTGRVRSLGLVLQIDNEDSARPFLANFIGGLTQAASDESWTITIAAEPTEAAVRKTLSRLIEERKADGFILPRTLKRDGRVETLRAAGVPFVMFGRTIDATGCAWYDIKGEDAMRAATARLASLGHKRIAHMPGGDQYYYSQLRLEGYKDGLASAGLPFDPDLVGQEAMTRRAGAQSFAALMALPEPPTAVVCAVDRAALGVYRGAEALGLRIGQEISVIAYDGVPEGAYASPGLTTFAVNSRQAGERLARLLIARIRGAAPEDLRELAPATLVERGSDRPPALSSHALAARLTDRAPIDKKVQRERRT